MTKQNPDETTPATTRAKPAKRQRMTRAERREQLIGIARGLFAQHGYDAVSVEEIASSADVSKPVVYEHFGGKEGLYQVIVDRETTAVSTLLNNSMGPGIAPRKALEQAILGLLDYIEENPDGFGLMVHQSPGVLAGAPFSTIMSDVGEYLTSLLVAYFRKLDFDEEAAPLYAQMLAGLVGTMGQWWSVNRTPDKETLAAAIVNLIWNGLRSLERAPELSILWESAKSADD